MRGLRPKKRLGQNFLIDSSAARRIAALAREGTERVLEIGAGTGALTGALLAEGLDVTALEIDANLVAILRERPDLAGAHIVEANALEYDFASYAGDAAWTVAGNLPYNIATPLVTRLVEMSRGPAAMTVMVQRDVADRFAAQPGTSAYGSLSVAVQLEMHVRRAFVLPPRAFFPQPKVESAVVRMTRRTAPAVSPVDIALFRKVVRGAFAYRRKTLVNSLALALDFDRKRVERAMATVGIPLEQRGERLDLDDFAALADALAKG